MSDMLKGFVTKALDEQIVKNYPHMAYPASVLAKVVSVREEQEKYVCILKILDKNGQLDNRFPEVPFVETNIELATGDIAVVLLLYGECRPYIIGRYD